MMRNISETLNKIKRTDDQAGFTLVEMLVVIAMSSILLLAVGVYMDRFSQTRDFQKVTADTHNDCRQALEFMSREIRMAGLNPWEVSDGSIGIISATPTTLRFVNDYNSNGTVESNEEFTFTLVGTSLQMTDGGGTVNELLNDVTGLGFTYLDQAGNVLASPVNLVLVRTIGINITVTRTYGRARATRTLGTMINCRNLSI